MCGLHANKIITTRLRVILTWSCAFRFVMRLRFRGAFHFSKQCKRFPKDFHEIFVKTKGFATNVYEISMDWFYLPLIRIGLLWLCDSEWFWLRLWSLISDYDARWAQLPRLRQLIKTSTNKHSSKFFAFNTINKP